MQYSVGLYAELKELTGNDPGWHQLGGLRLASSQPRLEEIRRQASWARTFGLPMEIVSPEEAQRLFPPLSTDGVLGAAFIPDDGYLDPSQLTFALADGGRVYVSGESSDRWHTATGGGIWFAFIKRTNTVSIAAAHSVERTGIYVRAGFAF